MIKYVITLKGPKFTFTSSYLVKTWNLAKRNMTRKFSRTLLNRSSSRLFLDDEVTTTILRVPGVAVYIYLAVAPFFLPFPLDPLLD